MFMLLEQSDVFVDAMASDHHAQLLFMSLYGRDTSVQQFMARLHQSTREGGISQVSAVERYGAKPLLQVMVGDPRRLEKATGRLPRAGLLGNLVHAWIFDPVVMSVDHATRSAWILEPSIEPDELVAQAWRLTKEISPVPLLEEWRDVVMDHIRMVRGAGRLESPRCIGRIHAHRVELQDEFAMWISSGVRDGLLSVPAEQFA